MLLRTPDSNGGTVVDGPTPTPFSVVSAETNEDALISVQVGDTQALSLTVNAPNAFVVGDRQFAVQRTAIGEDGVWTPTLTDENTAVWVRGTVVNYVLAMLDTEANRELMMSLDPSSALTLQTKEASNVPFKFSERLVVQSTNNEIFSQTAPGLTVVLIGAEANQPRMVVRGRYEFDQSADSTAAQQQTGPVVVQAGEWAQLGEAKVVVASQEAQPQQGSPFTYYLVNYQIENASTSPLDTSQLQFVLVDDVGNQYQLNALATQASTLAPMPAVVEPAGFIQATAGYQIPTGLNAGALRWIVRSLDSGLIAEVQLGDSSADTASVAETTVISLNSGDVTEDNNNLILQGEILNLAESALVVEQSDVSMLSNDGSVQFVTSTNPGFPWVIEAGQTLPYSVVVARPISADIATFTILHQSFELAIR